MNLDNLEHFAQIDSEHMIKHIDRLPDQLENAWNLGQRLELPKWENIQRVLVVGMGGSAMGADLLVAYCKHTCTVPLLVNRDYDLPAWARGPETLVVAASHSGKTQETLAGYQQAIENGCSVLAITTGGQLGELASRKGTTLWEYHYDSQPRAAVGFSFCLLTAVVTRLNLIPDPSAELTSAVNAMRQAQTQLKADTSTVQNPAKRLAGQLVDRWAVVIGSGILAPVARRWKNQINELAKAWGQFEILPEADHNLLAGAQNPAEVLSKTVVLFLRAPSDRPDERLRNDLTRKAFMLQGLGTDPIDAKGETPLAHMWTALHFGDYTAFYLAMAYGINPTPIEIIELFKQDMQSSGD